MKTSVPPTGSAGERCHRVIPGGAEVRVLPTGSAKEGYCFITGGGGGEVGGRSTGSTGEANLVTAGLRGRVCVRQSSGHGFCSAVPVGVEREHAAFIVIFS